MSSIEEKLKTFEDLTAHFDQFEKIIMDSMHTVESQLDQLNSSGQWQDPHVSNFKSGFLSYYVMSITTAVQGAVEAKDFLQNKHSTLTTHRN